MNDRPEYLCLRCWQTSDFLDLSYSCSMCAQAQRGMRKPRRVKNEFSCLRRWAARPSRVSCPRHPQGWVQLFCSCGAPLRGENQIKAAGKRPVGLGLAGAAGAGKTVMMLSALRELRGSPGGGDGMALLGIGDTERRFATLEDEFFRTGRKPARTEEADVLGFGWRALPRGSGRRTETLLLLSDVAGEVWNTGPAVHPEETSRYFGFLRKLVFVVDGASIAADLNLPSADAWDPHPRTGDRGAADAQVLVSLRNLFSDAKQKMDIALAISKGDLLWSSPDWQDLKGIAQGATPAGSARLRQLLKQTDREHLLDWSEHSFRRAEPFIFSGIGFRPEASQVGADHALVTLPSPCGAAQPIRWLLERP